jgi:hypothetical protein
MTNRTTPYRLKAQRQNHASATFHGTNLKRIRASPLSIFSYFSARGRSLRLGTLQKRIIPFFLLFSFLSTKQKSNCQRQRARAKSTTRTNPVLPSIKKGPIHTPSAFTNQTPLRKKLLDKSIKRLKIAAISHIIEIQPTLGLTATTFRAATHFDHSHR